MTYLSDVYDQLAQPWTNERLASQYREAKLRGERSPECEQDPLIRRPIAMLAAAIPACATLSIAVHVIHLLPATGASGLVGQLLGNAERSAAVALHRCHRALELDGGAHHYTADEWLPPIYGTAASLLEAACLNDEPPSLVDHAQQTIRWLSQAITALDQDSQDPVTAIVDGLARILALHVFTDIAGTVADQLQA